MTDLENEMFEVRRESFPHIDEAFRNWVMGDVHVPPDVLERRVEVATVVANVVAEVRRQQNLTTGKIPKRVAVVLSKLDGLEIATRVRSGAKQPSVRRDWSLECPMAKSISPRRPVIRPSGR